MAGARRQGLETFFSIFVPFVGARPFRTHVQEGGEEDCVQALLLSRKHTLAFRWARQGKGACVSPRGCDHAVNRISSRQHLPRHLPHVGWASCEYSNTHSTAIQQPYISHALTTH